ncbi:MAG: PKD domain-containing [Bacteroidetes bacterium]|nr:MAG: PKD domain-containing [Bacteroidota bacterium]
MLSYISMLLTAFLVVGSFGQISSQNPAKSTASRGVERSLQKGMDFPDFPQLESNKINRSITLPAVVDNSTQPYLRPIFAQSGASCGQSASVAYNFCYEINRLRQIPSDTISNTYPDHFTWNFMNATFPYYGEGVSYFQTFDILYDAGNPTEEVYGPITMDDSYFWMSGYEKYLSAMYNRISGANSIHVGTPQGLEILKHWLHNHLDGSEVGGVANFYAGISYISHLPPNSPEAGKSVITTWLPNASHAMTIVGYNDSIRFDSNGDGMFTNHLDINNDGVVDMRDWEIGGLKFANSYGDYWGNDGFAYLMYSTLAMPYGFGGIWNNSAHVIYPDTAYKPKLTLRAKIKHNKRGRLKLSAGVSPDTSNYYPSHIVEFPIFNHQGGDFNMTGNPLAAGQTLELGLDITSLLSHFEPGTPARVFLVVDEKDADNKGNGEIQEFEIFCHAENGEVTSYSSTDTPTGVANNSRTLVSAAVDLCGNPPQLQVEELVAVTPGQTINLEASVEGGQAPYQWKLRQVYYTSDSLSDYPGPQGEEIVPTNNTGGYAAVNLPFSFSFYGNVYDTVYMHTDGYIMFSRSDMPYTYLLNEDHYMRSITAISPFMHSELGLFKPSDYLMHETDGTKVRFYWKLSKNASGGSVMFAVELTSEGLIRYHYGENTLEEIIPVIGISPGTERKYMKSSRSQWMPANGEIRSFIPALPYGAATLTGEGQISISTPENFTAGEFILAVEDSDRLTDEKTVTISSGIRIETELKNGLKVLLPGQLAPLVVKVTNSGQQNITNAALKLNPGFINTVIQGGVVSGIDLPAGESRIFDGNFSLLAPDTATIAQDLSVAGVFSSGQNVLTSRRIFRLAVPGLTVNPPVVIDNNNAVADPGEEVTLSFNIINTGEVDAGNVECSVAVNSPYGIINSELPLHPGYLKALKQINVRVKLKLNDSAPHGKLLNVQILVNSESAGQFQGNFPITIGNPDILVIDKDKNHNSSVHIAAAIRNLNIACDQIEEIDTLVNKYSTVFLSLGFFMQNHRITTYEDSLLVEFLNKGGKLYLEGGAFFKQDPVTELRGKLGVTGLTQAWVKPADTLLGASGTPVQEFKIDYRGDAVRGENLIAVEPAETWMSDKNSGLNFVVALDSGNYKTIASTVEFGGFFMFDSPGRPELMSRYLNFLDYPTEPLCVTFLPSARQICPGNTISFKAAYSKLPATWNWSFPGGTPDTWNGPQPEIQYKTAGTYDVSLTVSEGTESNTFFIENMITVNECLGIQEVDTHRLKIYPNPASDKLTIESESIIGLAEISMLDSKGMEVFRQVIQSDNHSLSVSLPQLKAGFYILMLNCDNKITWSKLIIQ